MIHPTAIIHPKAKVHASVKVGPYAIIDEGVELGPDCVLGPYVYLTGNTTIGALNRFFAGCVIGEAPQDLKYKNEPTRLIIGESNTFREHCTVHRSAVMGEVTSVGSQNLVMAGSHIAHDCHIGNGVILANGAIMGGHVYIHDHAMISGSCLIHQFVRIGTLALMQGGSAVSKDLPPYTVARGNNGICGLNTVGLRRAGVSSADRLELKRLYRALFRSQANLREAVSTARDRFSSAPSKVMLEFLATAKRGVCSDTSAGYVDEEVSNSEENSM
jgi:UDP-N-acetylglucosamine acyltransferase